MQVLSSGQVSLPPPPNLAGEVLSIEQLSLPPPPNLAGEVVTVVTKCPAGTLAIHRPDGFAAGNKKAKHKCPECGCGFKTKTRMTSHVKTFHPEKAVTIPCHICNRTYSDKYLLQLHVKKVHECREEDTSSELTRHMAQAHERRKEDKKFR